MKEPNEPGPETAPLFGTWRKAYLAIVLVFILQVAIFYLFSRYFS